MSRNHYDVVIVGAGIAGSSLAHALSTLPSQKSLRIALLERSLAEPDRIVGELLQPAGVLALQKLDLQSCLEGIDAIPVHGYCVVEGAKSVGIPYPAGYEGRSFHHGRFIMNLRRAASQAEGVDMIEATVTGLLEAEPGGRVVGVCATKKSQGQGVDKETHSYYADLVFIADGCFSNFRNAVMGPYAVKSTTRSHFVGAILENARLPMPNHGTVALIRGSGPVLLYQISENDTRILVDVLQPLPADLKDHILTNIMPQLPSTLHAPIELALNKDRLRRMPNTFLPPIEQGNKGFKEGVILIGDSWNMRHPLTGGGMTVALHDVVQLQSLIDSIPDLRQWEDVRRALHKWYWRRKPLASTVNILSVALYDLLGAEDENLNILRTGCFKYFELGGECVNGPVSLLSGVAPSPLLLAYHFFAVAFYSIWVLFTHPQPVTSPAGTIQYTTPRFYQYPALFIKSGQVFWTACIVFGPLLWTEIRWWAPSDRWKSSSMLTWVMGVGILGGCLVIGAAQLLW